MAGSLLPEPKQQFLNDIGLPLFAGKIFTYAAGTLTPKKTYQDAALTEENTNPVIANGRGEVVMYGSGNYRVILKDAFENTIYDRDNIETADVATNNLKVELLSLIGSSLVGWKQDGFGAVYRTVQSELRDRQISVKQFGAVADWNGVTGTDNSDAFDAALTLALLTGRSIFVPTGSYRITRPIVMDTGVYTRGIIMSGEGINSKIYQSGAGQDAIHFSTTQFLQNSGLRDLSITCAADAGHCVNIVYGCTTCFVSNVEMAALNTVKSCVYGDYTSFGGGIFDTKFSGGSWYLDAASVAGGFVIRANGTIFNENMFENLRVYQANTKQFFDIRTVGQTDIWLVNNSWKNINVEVCRGGGFIFDSFKNCTFENISFWDSVTPYTNNLIDMAPGVAFESVGNTFINVTRNGDSLAPSVRDVRIASGQDTVFINCYTPSGVGPSYDFGLKRVTVIGRMYGVNSAGNTNFILPESISVPTVVADTIAGGTLSIGGRGSPETVAMTYAGGFFQITPIPVSSGLIFTSTTAGGTQSKLIFSPDIIYPLTDNFVSLGTAGQRWTQVYAAAGTINTSDENSKDIRQEGIDPAVLRAWAKVEFYQYKFRDAVELKGDGARWHFGVVAQRVKEAFESEGLDAFAYGLLCYDEWEDLPALMDPGEDALLDEDGNEIKPARAASEIKPAQQAGARFGIRYEEALTLECAYLRSKIS